MVCKHQYYAHAPKTSFCLVKIPLNVTIIPEADKTNDTT